MSLLCLHLEPEAEPKADEEGQVGWQEPGVGGKVVFITLLQPFVYCTSCISMSLTCSFKDECSIQIRCSIFF